jgi:hypothetical protein
MRQGWLSLLIAVAGGAVHADEPPKSRHDLAAEIAWARATWPDDFKGLHFHAPLAKLLAWAPRKGTVPAYLYTEDHACQRLELSRDEPDERDPDTPPGLDGQINGPASHKEIGQSDGRPTREVWNISIGLTLSHENGSSYFEAQDEHGAWQPAFNGGGWSRPTVYGALSSVDDRVARFGGDAQTIHAYCGGPTEWLPCPLGGDHPCDRCDRVELMILDAEIDSWGHGNGYGGRPISCQDKCPRYPESPDLARIQALDDPRIPLWRPKKAPLAAIPSLYKSRDDCLREHPPRGKNVAPRKD